MKAVFQIFWRDIRRLASNKAACLVMAGVCLLPSLYAWFNIFANMDPYSNTAGIKVAIANADTGATQNDLTVNAGDTIVQNLKENDQLGWTFVDESAAKQGVQSGKYYAAIVIPEDFSESLLSILSGKLEQPKLDYYINEKKNAIAPKITDTGATTIQQEINDTFSSIAAESISEIVRSSAEEMAGDVANTSTDLVRSIQKVQDNLSQYQNELKTFQDAVSQSDSSITNALSALDDVSLAAKNGSAALNDTSDLLAQSRSALGDFSTQFSGALSDSESLLNDAAISANSNLGVFETNANKVLTTLGSSVDTISSLNKKNEALLEQLKELSDRIGDDTILSDTIAQQIATLQQQNASLQELLDSLSSGNSAMQDALNTSVSTRKSLEQLAKDSKSTLRKHRKQLDSTVLPEVNQSLDGLSSVNGDLSSALNGVPATVNQIKAILSQLRTTMNDTSSALGQAGETLGMVNNKLGDIITDLHALRSSNAYQKLLELQGIDADGIADFMSSPVSLKSDVQYDVKNYGSGMTPFYTNLALWVGGLILVSILKQEVDTEGLSRSVTPTQSYLGRGLLFFAAGFVQSIIVCVGDLFLPGVQCVHPTAFVLAGAICSFVYVNIIYALAAAFKHIGKAVAVVLIILQIPGSSGTYPIEMMPEFFQELHPFFPFSYGINAMRECIAGFYGNAYWRNLLSLLIFLAIALFTGLVLRPLLQNLNYLFDRRLADTDLMLCETATAKLERPQLRMMLRTLMRDEAGKKKFLEQSAKFEATYQKRVRYGFIGMLVIPLIFLLLMFSLDSKLVFLVLWIVSLIALSLYLIVMEYIHDRIQRQIALNGLTSDDLVRAIKEKEHR